MVYSAKAIFGPVKDINPHDSKLKGVRSREAAVDKEGNLVTKSIARRERMGHIYPRCAGCTYLVYARYA